MSNKYKLAIIILAGLLIRILLNGIVPSHDAISFVIWSKYLTQHSLAELYTYLPDGYLAYPPVYYYILMPFGWVINLFNLWNNQWLSLLIIKIPVIVSDIISTLLIYRISQDLFGRNKGLISAAFYFLNPTIIYITSVWGQIDSVIIMLGLLIIYFFLQKKYYWGSLLFTLGFLTKLQMFALFPLIIILLIKSGPLKRFIKITVLQSVISIILFLPVVIPRGILWTIKYFAIMPNQYPYTSVYAYNLWAPFGFIVSDKLKIFGFIEFRLAGMALLLLVAGVIVLPLFRQPKLSPQVIYFAAFLLFFAFAFFPTRIHSRYLIYAVGLFSSFIAVYPISGILLSGLMITNLLLPDKSSLIVSFVWWLNQPLTIISFTGFTLILFLINCRNYIHLIKNENLKHG